MVASNELHMWRLTALPKILTPYVHCSYTYTWDKVCTICSASSLVSGGGVTTHEVTCHGTETRVTRSRVTARRHVSRGHVSRGRDTCHEVTCHGLIVPHAALFYSEIFQDHYNASSFPRPSEFSRGIGENSHQKSEIICHELARCQFSPLIKFWHGI